MTNSLRSGVLKRNLKDEFITENSKKKSRVNSTFSSDSDRQTTRQKVFGAEKEDDVIMPDASDDYRFQRFDERIENSKNADTLCYGMLNMQINILPGAKQLKYPFEVSINQLVVDIYCILSVPEKKLLGTIDSEVAPIITALLKQENLGFFLYITAQAVASTKSHICINVYGCRDKYKINGRWLSRNKLFLQPAVYMGKENCQYDNPHILKVSSRAAELLGMEHTFEIAQNESLETSNKEVEFVVKTDEINGLFNSVRSFSYDVSNLQISERIKTSLKDHQLQALAYMLNKEEYGSSGTNCVGGILADEMGMGKTLTVLSLIATSAKRSIPGPTLIIAPLSVVAHWESQIQIHTCDISVLLYNKHQKQPDMSDFDIVITTYGKILSDSKSSDKTLTSFRWRRIVLDEAHIIRQRKAKQSQAICSLQALHRWCITGTPVQNCLDDYGSLLQFLRVQPYDNFNVFRSQIVLPMKKHDPLALQRLQDVIKSTTLRRSKDLSNLNLPARSDTLEKLNFSNEEEKLHKLLTDFTIKEIETSLCNGAKGSGSGTYITQLIVRLRQACNHGSELLPEKLKKSLIDFSLGSTDVFEQDDPLDTMRQIVCDSCFQELPKDTDPFLFEDCQHVLCPLCSRGVIQGSCQVCTKHLESTLAKTINPSTKVKALMENLRACITLGEKSVVFSCWTKMLDLVEPQLVSGNIEFERVDGAMNTKQRDKSINTFQNSGSVNVLLVSIGTGSVGLDLTAASQVHLLEPQFNPMLEEQALARVHRMGQTRPIRTIRYIMKNSYEEQIVEKQQKKLQLAQLCVSGKVIGVAETYLEYLRAVL